MALNTDWDNYRVFLAVAEKGGLVAGARAAAMSEHAARRRLAALERDCGFALFRRTVAGLSPTPAGHQLVAIAQAMARDLAGQSPVEAEGVGLVRVLTSGRLPDAFLAPVFASLAEAYPRLVLQLDTAHRAIDPGHGPADVMVVLARPAEDQAVVGFWELPFGLYAHRDYLARAGQPASPEDLRSFSLVGAESAEITLDVIAALGVPVRLDDIFVQADTLLGAYRAVQAGVGIGLGYVAVADTEPDLVRVLPSVGATAHVWLILREGDEAAAAARLVAAAIANRLESLASPAVPAAAG